MPRSSANLRDRVAKMPEAPNFIQNAAFLCSRSEQLSNGVSSTPLNGRVSARKESAVKPGSVLDSHSSGMRVAAQL